MNDSKKINPHLFPYEWNLSDGYPSKGIEHHKSTVFGTFICGGGSSMGYELAGYKHLGGVEIDTKVADVYKTNHNPKHLFVEDIREFNKRENLPKELFNLDLLDGSPPCSSFSMAGNRDKDWGKKKVFREGQANQVLDDLVFEYIKTIEKLKPKVAILENVKGLIQGNAKAYAKKIFEQFKKAGYRVQLFLLNAASMGVPQKRERVFFIGLRNDIDLPKLVLEFNENPILLKSVLTYNGGDLPKDGKLYSDWLMRIDTDKHFGNICDRTEGKSKSFGRVFLNERYVANTLVSGNQYVYHKEFKEASKNDLCKIGSYPLDYNFKKLKPVYLIGMSVPPVMTAQIANQIYLQWLSKIN